MPKGKKSPYSDREIKEMTFKLRREDYKLDEIRKKLKCGLRKVIAAAKEIDPIIEKEEKGRIISLFKSGQTVSKIMSKSLYGRHKIERILREEGLLTCKRCPFKGENLKKKIIELYKKGHVADDIRYILGCRYESVIQILKEDESYKKKHWKRLKDSYVKIPPLLALSYMAGIIDGEGSIYHNRADFSNTSFKVMEWAKNTFGGDIYVIAIPGKTKKCTKKCYRWSLSGIKNIYLFLKAIFPYLIVKKERAAEVIKLCEGRIKFEEDNEKRKRIVTDARKKFLNMK